MSEYFNPPNDILPVSRAKSSQIKELRDSIVSAFDALPTNLGGLKTEIVAARGTKETLMIRIETAEQTTEGHRDQAQGFVNEAEGHKEVARQWAEGDRGVLVETEGYSAKHHSLVAKDYVSNLLINPIFSSSITNIVVSKGVKTILTDPGRTYREAMWILIVDRADPEIWLRGYVTAYDFGTGFLTITVNDIAGSGSGTDWLITQANPGPGSSSGITAIGLFTMQSFS